VRTALGVATLSFYAVCFLGGSADLISSTFGLSVNAVLITFRVALFALPVLSAMVTYRLCRELCARDGLPMESRVAFKEILSRLFRRAPVTDG
jgi:ubiquinol-cytochrome c reductase cytochrome b subunit